LRTKGVWDTRLKRGHEEQLESGEDALNTGLDVMGRFQGIGDILQIYGLQWIESSRIPMEQNLFMYGSGNEKREEVAVAALNASIS